MSFFKASNTQDQVMLLVVINFYIIKRCIAYVTMNGINVYCLINFYSFDCETFFSSATNAI